MRCFPCKTNNSRHASLAAVLAMLLMLLLVVGTYE
jgi:hypothetical protein